MHLLAVLLLITFGIGKVVGQTEQDYFSELPEVLTVTRLAQPLSETPGAVTVIDRETIRRSGTRDVSDLLRLVPGYIVYGWNGANPTASYHAALDDYGTRNQVLIDGRSVYSGYYLGNTQRGMMGIVLEDIERIEVLRGSNSAAYGANAFLGVINIITRHAADTHGGLMSVTSGDEGVKDNLLRYGWASNGAHYRLTAARQSDNGYRNAHDDKGLGQLHFRGDLQVAPGSELMLSAGVFETTAGEGFSSSAGNPLRTIASENIYFNGVLKKQLAADEDLRLTTSFSEEAVTDRSRHGTVAGVVLDYGGRARRFDVELQHSFAPRSGLRVVWGGGVHHELAESVPLYFDPKVSITRLQLFGNLEWRPHARWVINAGSMLEKHSTTGSELAPRLAANFQLAHGHTLRGGLSRSFRSPSLFELEADVRYYVSGTQVGRTARATGGAKAESIESREVGYLGEIPSWRFSLDVRAFEERLKGLIRPKSYAVQPSLAVTGTTASDYVNYPGFYLRGIEYQMRWKPLADTEIWFNQSFVTPVYAKREQDLATSPRHLATLAVFQRMPGGLELTAVLHGQDSMSHRNVVTDKTDPLERLDLRVAYPFRMGSTKAEIAVTVQAANGDHPIYLPSQKFEYDRRTFGTLKVEF
jgi:iron complex outermembrane receptor protein